MEGSVILVVELLLCESCDDDDDDEEEDSRLFPSLVKYPPEIPRMNQVGPYSEMRTVDLFLCCSSNGLLLNQDVYREVSVVCGTTMMGAKLLFCSVIVFFFLFLLSPSGSFA